MILEASGPVKFAKIDLSATGSVVAAVPGKKIRPVAVFATNTTGDGTIAITSGDGEGATDRSGAMSFDANGQLNLPFNPCGWCETEVGEPLVFTLDSTGQVSGLMAYQLVD